MSDLKNFNATIMKQNNQEYLTAVLGEKKSSFVNNLTALVSNDAKLQACTPLSLIYAGIKATALDLPLDSNLGFAYVIPYKDNSEKDEKGSVIEKTVAQLQIGYKGFKQLAIRSGQFRVINATDVRDGEVKKRNRLTSEIEFDFIQNDAERLSKKIIGFVSYFELLNGFSQTFYMSVEELTQHGLKYSKTFNSNKKWVKDSSKWVTDFDAMCLKTVTKLNLSKNAPLSVEMQTAIKSDQAVISEKGEIHVDNQINSDGNEKALKIINKAFEQIEDAKEIKEDDNNKTLFEEQNE